MRRRKTRAVPIQLGEDGADQANGIDEQFWAEAASRPTGQMLMGMDDDDEGECERFTLFRISADFFPSRFQTMADQLRSILNSSTTMESITLMEEEICHL